MRNSDKPLPWAVSLGFSERDWHCESCPMLWVEVTHYRGKNYLTERLFCPECGEVFYASRKEIP